MPSYLIPQMWFDYLRNRDARPLEGVFYHHKMGILSLVALSGWLSRCLAAPNGAGFVQLIGTLGATARYGDGMVHLLSWDPSQTASLEDPWSARTVPCATCTASRP